MLKTFVLCFVVIVTALVAGPVMAGEIHAKPPKSPDRTQHYLFYMHGTWLETHGEHERDRRQGVYKYTDILNTFADQGFVVIAEKRGRVKNKEYVQKIARQVRELLDAGVPARNITVSGFSKGGAMTLEAGIAVRNPNVNFVVLSGCGIGEVAHSYQRLLKRGAAMMQGRFLSIYDSRDTVGGTCMEAFRKANLSAHKEIVLTVGSGHAVFFQPLKEWVDPMATWAKGP